MKTAGKIVLAAFVALQTCCLLADTTINRLVTTGDPPKPGTGSFYGYKNNSTGPGDDAFQKIHDLAVQNHCLLILYFGKDGCSKCNGLAADFNQPDTTVISGAMLKYGNACNAHFRGSDSNSAKAWLDAKAFLQRITGQTDVGCHTYAAFGVFEDGVQYSSVSINATTTYGAFASWRKQQCDEFNKQAKNHHYVPPKANAAFACGDGVNSGLQMVSNMTERVYVPFVRKTNLTNVETNWLAVTYPGETVASTNIEFVWSATGPAATNIEVAVSVSNRWVKGEKIRLEYLNFDNVSIETNWISCVTVTNGTFDSPWMPGEKTADELGWGEWTLDFAAATNRARRTGGVTIAVLGSPVWTDAGALFGSKANHAVVTNFCKNANATLAVIDHADANGASLLSHVVEDGWSGTPFLSRRGLSTADAAVTGLRAEHDRLWGELQTENNPDRVEVAVLRTDGTRVGMLKIQRTADGEPTNWDENMARLLELIATANDEYASDCHEDVNNRPQAGVAELKFTAGSVQVTETNSLSVSDRVDFFKLSGLQAKTPIELALVDCNEEKRTQKSGITLSVVCVTNAVKGLYRILEPAASSNVWMFAGNELGSAYVRVAAWQSRETRDEGALASAANSKVVYRVRVTSAPEEPGTVGFVTESDIVEVTDAEIPFPVEVRRVGYTGLAKVTLSLDESLTTAPAESYSFPTPASATWGDAEWGIKSIDGLKLLNKGDWDEGGDIVLTLAVTDGDAGLVGTNKLWLTVTQKEDPTAPTGKIVISEPFAAERFYAEAEEELPVRIDRVGGKRGPLAVKVSVPEGTITTNALAWKRYNTERKTVTWTLPPLGATQPYRNVALRLIGIDGTPVASNTLNVCVLPAGALKPETNDRRIEVAQYSGLPDADAKIKFTGTLPDGATLSPMRISGSLPSGISTPTVDAAMNLVFSGVSSRPGTYVSTWWLAVRNAKRQIIGYSHPVKVTIVVKALVEKDEKGQVTGGVNPMFATARSWTSLPLIGSMSGRLEGLLDLTVATTGKATARFRKAAGKTVSFSMRGLTSVDLESGLANAEATASGYQLKVRLYKSGCVAADLYGPGLSGYLHCETKDYSVAWSAANTAEAWKGNYTIAFAPGGEWDAKTLCFGSPVLQLKFTSKSQWNTGKVTYAGYLPNGKSVSGSAQIVETPRGAGTVSLPVFATSATDTLSAMLDITNETAVCVGPAKVEIVENFEVTQSGTVTSFWDHVESNVSALSYGNPYVPFGSRFADEGWKAADFKQAVEGATSAQYNKTSGLVSGSLRRTAGGKTVTETWKAVVTPGWEVLLGGASWRNVSTNAVNDKTGKPVRRTVQVGEAVEADAE